MTTQGEVPGRPVSRKRTAKSSTTIHRPECGTVQGWWRHYRGFEDACRLCKRAVAIGMRTENALSLDQAIEELRALQAGRRFWNPNLAEQKDKP